MPVLSSEWTDKLPVQWFRSCRDYCSHPPQGQLGSHRLVHLSLVSDWRSISPCWISSSTGDFFVCLEASDLRYSTPNLAENEKMKRMVDSRLQHGRFPFSVLLTLTSSCPTEKRPCSQLTWCVSMGRTYSTRTVQ